MAKNTEYEFEETMVTLTDEDGIDKDFYVDEIYEVDSRLYAALIPVLSKTLQNIMCSASKI